MPEPRSPDTSVEGISSLSVSGFKSIDKEQTLEIRPLTLLAGANSSGKSSMMQPLLLLKQTVEATYDPGPLLLDGPNVKFTSSDQLLSRTTRSNEFNVGISTRQQTFLAVNFNRRAGRGLEIGRMHYRGVEESYDLTPDMGEPEILKQILESASPRTKELARIEPRLGWEVIRNRCFLEIRGKIHDEAGGRTSFIRLTGSELARLQSYVGDVIHVTGLRGSPERVYPLGPIGPRFPGIFERYTASVISQWQTQRKIELSGLGEDLKRLGLTWKATARKVSDTQVELQVGRLPEATRGGASDLVNIADVGFGVSQTLPVLVALRAARPGQLVYVEQPEIHLHPRAQTKLADLLVNAANRGVRVVAETHSALLLLGIQTAVAAGRISPSLVKLHWFSRSQVGSTTVTSADIDNTGAFGNWPEDFSDVVLEAEGKYLGLAQSRIPQE
jgi:hypothetical protein